MRPHILYILSDQHSAFAPAETPWLDELRKKGVSFSDAYCSSPLCVPSRAGLLTGLLPTHTGVWNNTQCLPSDRLTFAHYLTVAGYDTVLCGRMHFNLYDQYHGFAKHLVGEITPTFPRPERQKDVYGALAGSPDQSLVSIEKSGAGWSSVLDYDQEVARTACLYLRDHADPTSPLFLLVGFYGPHCPFVAQKHLYEKYYKRFASIKACREYGSLHPQIRRFIDLRGIRDLTDDDVRRTTAAYCANVEFLDSLIGEVIQTASQTIGLDNTVIVYSSDHGESLDAHGLYWKSNFYRESVNVPLVFRWDGVFKPHVETAPISLLDVAPTILGLCEGGTLQECDGIDLASVLSGRGNLAPERNVVSMLSDLKGDSPSAMIRSRRYKLIKYCQDDVPLLFDEIQDPTEMHDLGSDPAYQKVRTELLAKLHEYWNEQEELAQFAHQKKDSALRKQWIARTKPEPVGEWNADSAHNYLLSRGKI